MSSEVYRILLDIMDENNLSIPDVARACNLSDSTVRGIIKRQQSSIALDVAFKLSAGLGVSLERLNGMDDPKKERLSDKELAKQLKKIADNELFTKATPEVLEALNSLLNALAKQQSKQN